MKNNTNTTLAISLLVNGEAVRLNRGKLRGDDYDFKYLQGPGGKKYPYVSSQCFKKYWREALQSELSPIIREKSAKGKEKNQAFTLGDPIHYIDDDLFGYMVAGAAEESSDKSDSLEGQAVEGVSTVDEALQTSRFDVNDIVDASGLLTRLKDSSDNLGVYLRDHLSLEDAQILDETEPHNELGDHVVGVMLNSLNQVLKDRELYDPERFTRVRGIKKPKGNETLAELMELNKNLLQKAFSKQLRQEKKRPTTRRTAPVRMHALVGFSALKMAKDFQTFSRDVALSGKNSIVNPNPVGIYSGWLKTRILIEAHRIGKFFVGPNLDILPDLAEGNHVFEQVDPYSRTGNKVSAVKLDERERRHRLQEVIEALANVGNRQGPASGALHDGSLRPKAFIAGLMNCADSPFDSVWRGTDETPHLDLHRLSMVLDDWADLFASRKIYVGLPVEYATEDDGFRASLEETISAKGFEPVAGSPRRIMLRMAQEVSTLAIPNVDEATE